MHSAASVLGPPADASSVPASVPAVVYEFPKNSREMVVASLQHYRGRQLANLRVCVPDTRGGWLFTAKGLAVTVDQLPHLEAAVRALREAAEAGGLLTAPAPSADTATRIT